MLQGHAAPESLDARFNNDLRGVKVRLTSSQADDVYAALLQVPGQIAEHHGLGWLQACHRRVDLHSKPTVRHTGTGKLSTCVQAAWQLT